MKVYRCLRRFYCSPLGMQMPEGTTVVKHDHEPKLVVGDVVLSGRDETAWFLPMEPPPAGASMGWFAFVKSLPEAEPPRMTLMTANGLPLNSKLQIGIPSGNVFFENVTTSLWHRTVVDGVDGNAYLSMDQFGVVAPT